MPTVNIVHTDYLQLLVAKQWEQQQSKSLITESSIYNKQYKISYQKRLVCGPQQRRKLILPESGVQNGFSYTWYLSAHAHYIQE